MYVYIDCTYIIYIIYYLTREVAAIYKCYTYILYMYIPEEAETTAMAGGRLHAWK